MIQKRDLSIDYLRFIGLSLIILAHATAPFTITQLRCFDVPLMIFISGLTAAKKIIPNYGKYIISRTERLLVPVYIFITFYLLLLFTAQSLGFIPTYVNLKMVIDSYLLLGGIGYVWIIRVFLLMMLVTPLLVHFEIYCKNNIFYGFICLVLLVLNDLILNVFVNPLQDSCLKTIIEEYIIYLLGYSSLFMLGLRMRYISRKVMRWYVLFVVLLLIAGILIYKDIHGFPIEISPIYKYPPQSFYLIYGAIISILLWNFKNSILKFMAITKLSSLATFIGQNTIWIYLWHIPFVIFANKFVNDWMIRYIIIYSVSLLIFRVQYFTVNKANNKTLTKYFIG